jgi:dihydroorotate dehydrogenase
VIDDWYQFARTLLFALPPEPAHKLAIEVLKRGWLPPSEAVVDARLGVSFCGLAFDSPIGLAAGFDKNADVCTELFRHGFAFTEIGTLTPKAQSGNPKPRMFRLKEDEAVINRLGFNNNSAETALRSLLAQEQRRIGMVGVNIGKNKDTEDALSDYLPLIHLSYELADYITVNISSPNTQGLRDLQSEEAFAKFIKAIMQERNGMAAYRGFRRPVLVKIAPDMEMEALERMLDTVMEYRVDGVILTNTTIARPSSLRSPHAKETGGLSGRPLTEPSLKMLRHAYRYTQGKLPLVGVGGIMNGQDAVDRIRAGASLIQLYTGLIYRGFALVQEIKQALLDELDKEGLASVQDLIGLDERDASR